MKRQPDGRWRGVRQAIVVSEQQLRARWVEAETIHLKRMGLSFDAIAEQITRVGLGRASPITTLPQNVTFPAGYRITKQACHKAFRKALAREPALEVEEMRKLDNARAEEMYLSLQPGIRQGDIHAIEAGIRVLDHTAKLNGLFAPTRLAGIDGEPLITVQMIQAVVRDYDALEEQKQLERTAKHAAELKEGGPK
jgi:hypothetical protein